MDLFINRSNLFTAYKIVLQYCAVLIVIVSLLASYIVYFTYKRYADSTKDTFVFSQKGASVHVFVNQKKWKNYSN